MAENGTEFEESAFVIGAGNRRNRFQIEGFKITEQAIDQYDRKMAQQPLALLDFVPLLRFPI